MTLDVVERISGSSACKGNASHQRVTGGADLTTKPIWLTGMRKGSIFVREVALKGLYAVLVVGGCVAIYRHWSQKTTEQSARQKVRGVLYWVAQKVIQQLSQHIAVG